MSDPNSLLGPARGRHLRLILAYILPIPLVLIIALQPTIELRIWFAVAIGITATLCGIYFDVAARLLVRDTIERTILLRLRGNDSGSQRESETPQPFV